MQTDVEERLDIIRHKLKFIEAAQRPKVRLLRSLFPQVLLDDSSLQEIVEWAGGRPSQVAEADLLIIVTTEPMNQLLGILPDQLKQPEWINTPAVQNNRVYVVDGQHFLPSGSDDGMAEDAELLAEIINPTQFIYGYNGDGWMQFDLS
ncbi:iron complex transport system substrate-binding protein [bacterium A37T11]|nr:iron complex transport system substrate-binding protein [bacterium A37T11]